MKKIKKLTKPAKQSPEKKNKVQAYGGEGCNGGGCSYKY